MATLNSKSQDFPKARVRVWEHQCHLYHITNKVENLIRMLYFVMLHESWTRHVIRVRLYIEARLAAPQTPRYSRHKITLSALFTIVSLLLQAPITTQIAQR